jgi:metallo-beta-lactamase class B
MYIVTDDGVVIIDTPWDTTQCQPLLDSIQNKHGKKVIMAIATHYHDDRTGGFDFFNRNGIKTFSTTKTKALCVKHREKQAQFTFKNDTVFNVGKCRFRAFFPGEGHTKDNIVVWFPDAKILYGGCLVKSVAAEDLGNVANANIKAYPNTIKKLLAEFPDRKVTIPGHQSWAGDCLLYTLRLALSAQQNSKK